MKCIAVLSFIIGCLSAPIQAQAQNAASVDEFVRRQQEAEMRLEEFMRRQQEVARTLSNIAEMRHQMMKTVAENLRLPEQNAPPRIPYAPPTTPYYSGRGLGVQNQIDFNRIQSQLQNSAVTIGIAAIHDSR
jgi:hypothetical protein